MNEIFLPTVSVPYNLIVIVPLTIFLFSVLLFLFSRRESFTEYKREQCRTAGERLVFLSGIVLVVLLFGTFLKYGGMPGSIVVDRSKVPAEISHDYKLSFVEWKNKSRDDFRGEISGTVYDCTIKYKKAVEKNTYPYFVVCHNSGVDFSPVLSHSSPIVD